MTISTPPRHISTLQDRAPRLAAAGALIAGAAGLLVLLMGPGADYALIFPPPWLGVLGAVLLAAALALRAAHRPHPAEVGAWAAAVLLLGGSGGVVLDGFRAFFAVTGIPAGSFAEVDVPGAIARACALIAALTALLLARALRRRRRGGATRPGSPGSRRLLRGLGLAACVPYPALKLLWWASGDTGAPVMELALFALAAGGILALTARRGSGLPRWLVIGGGRAGALVLLSMGALMVFGLLAQVTQLAAAPVAFEGPAGSGIVLGVYSTWLLLGIVVAAATVQYEERSASVVDPAPPPDRKGHP